jgi:Ankyrin repeats (many copies)
MPPIAQSFFGSNIEANADSESVAMSERKQSPEVDEERGQGVIRECDFDKDPSGLYLELQKKDWNAAIARASSAPVEAKTWVVRKEFDGKLRWRLLPLHAAIIFKAPEQVIEALLGAYPRSAECKDDQGMLPLHLAFRNGSSEEIVNLLLVAYPQSIDVKDRKGRIPLVLAQASTSPNRDAFMRALERGPTYYAVAAAATERAAVTAELRAIFDAKLMEIKNQHQDEIGAINEEALYRQQELEDRVLELERELNKTQETSQILVDHVNSLEAQLTSRSDTERFLATKIATLDSSLRDVSRIKEETETTLQAENRMFKDEIESLKTIVESRDSLIVTLTSKIETLEADNEELAAGLGITKEKSVEEIQRLEMEWATARASAAVLEAQLKKKIETEHSLACQVSSLATKVAEAAYETSTSTAAYTAKIENLMNERAALRHTVAELTKKLTFVANELIKVAREQDQIIQATGAHEASMHIATETHAMIIENAHNHEAVMERINDERRTIMNMLMAQEQEIFESAKIRDRLRDAIAIQGKQHLQSSKEREELVQRVNRQKMDVRKIVEEDLAMIPTSLSEELEESELIDEVVRRANCKSYLNKEDTLSNQFTKESVTHEDNKKYAELEASLKEEAERRVAIAMETVLLNAQKREASKHSAKKGTEKSVSGVVQELKTDSMLQEQNTNASATEEIDEKQLSDYQARNGKEGDTDIEVSEIAMITPDGIETCRSEFMH